jgi:tetraacyldisaccharide-1-P 4'-kinase
MFLRPRYPVPALPLIVIGSLRAGGSGKTPVTRELARHLAANGKRVGILAYRIHGSGDAEVFPGSNWRESSDEAVLLARESGARVFVTRDRAALWRRLDRAGEFDVLIADDGLTDTRLTGFRVVLVRPGENPGWPELLPAGPYRSTVSLLKKVDHVLPFSRETVLPGNFDLSKSWWLLCGLGNPADLRKSLEARGVKVAGLSAGPDHGLPDLEKARRKARRAGASGFLYTEKDGIKLEGLPERETGTQIGERLTLSPAFLSALDAFLKPASS